MKQGERSPSELLANRLFRGVGATALGPVATAAIQLGSVPLLLRAWGPSKYGDWLLLSAVPTYLSFSGLGFGDSSASQMTMRAAAGDTKGALTCFQSSWLLVTAISLMVLISVSATVWWVPWQPILHLAGMTSGQAAQVILLLSLWILAGQQSNVIESGYRCDGNFALGNVGSTVQRLLEACTGTIIGVITGRVLWVAVSFVVCRLLGLIIYKIILNSLSPWLELGIEHASLVEVRQMFKPSLGFIALPVSNALSFQGFTVIVGIVLGPIAVTVFSTTRTLSRIGIQLINALANGVWPELSSAFGAGNLSLARTLHRHAYQATLILSVSCAAGLWAFGPAFYRIWAGKSISLDPLCFHILLLVTITSSLWYASAVVQMSANTHALLAFVLLVATLLSCLSAYFLSRSFGLAGAASALLVVDVIMCGFVLRKSLRQMQDTPGGFLRAVFGSTPYFLRPLLASCGPRR